MVDWKRAIKDLGNIDLKTLQLLEGDKTVY